MGQNRPTASTRVEAVGGRSRFDIRHLTV